MGPHNRAVQPPGETQEEGEGGGGLRDGRRGAKQDRRVCVCGGGGRDGRRGAKKNQHAGVGGWGTVAWGCSGAVYFV